MRSVISTTTARILISMVALLPALAAPPASPDQILERTALAGMMVDEGRWRWDTKVTEMFPELGDRITPEWRSATLEEFLTHYSGAGNDDCFNTGIIARAKMPPMEQRSAFIHDLLVKHGPVTRPGAVWQYDNANYIVVGHAIELELRQPWEDIIRERLFKPLGMDSAGFGPPARRSAL